MPAINASATPTSNRMTARMRRNKRRAGCPDRLDVTRVEGAAAAPSAAPAAAPGTWRPRANPWAIAVVVALGAFMEVLDTSIATVALPYMAGNLGATTDQSTWVLTSYLVSKGAIDTAGRRLVRQRAGAQALLSDLSQHLHVLLAALRHRAQHTRHADRLCACCRARAALEVAMMAQAILADTISAAAAQPRLRAVRHRSSPRGARSSRWRLDHRQLFVALDLPDQSAGGRRGVLRGHAAGRGPALVRPGRGRHDAHRLRGRGAARARRPAALQIMLDKGQELDWFGSPVHHHLRGLGGRRPGSR